MWSRKGDRLCDPAFASGSLNAEARARSRSSEGDENPDARGARRHQDSVSWCPEGTGVIRKGCNIWPGCRQELLKAH